jgi:thymidine phosphorylase
MTILLNNVYVALEQGIINTDQALYLIYTHREITYPIKVKELFQLTQLKYIVGNKIGKELLIEENIKLLKRYYQTYLQHRSIQENTQILALVGVKILLQSSLNFLQERLLSSTLLIISSSERA